MEVPHHGLHALVEHVGVDLRGGDVGVAEQLLHDAQVGAVLQQVAREGVAQHVRADALLGDAGRHCHGLEVAREGLARHEALLAVGREQPGA